ncbi:platelet-activating factor acetylhydrolase [Phyllosticta citribraziliensis]|uniref:Putative phospholipase n=1 Tax=Phyllosticta citribraziliensis TaxID=989973 RepID=A0ABR1L6Q1_9PEZI
MSWLSSLKPVTTLPEYPGPYKVGSIDVEIPVAGLNSPSPAPDSSISTVAYRIFYPCEPSASDRPVRWIPNPQRGYMAAYARFMGANSAFASVFSFFPQLFYYINIPVHRNAPLLSPPTKSSRWPVMVFSHGLGGTRNAYSQIVGSVSSHGVVVIAPEHRDGSCPISYIRATPDTPAKAVDYVTLSHEPREDVWERRDEQLKIRLWELGVIHDSMLKMDAGEEIRNLDENKSKNKKLDTSNLLSMFKEKLDMHRPGSIVWAGHSFGAATMHQLVKTIYWQTSPERKYAYVPLFSPRATSEIAKQITPFSPVVLLDMWCLPLQSPNTRWLKDKPMPCYAPPGPGGTTLVAILSEAFYNWSVHMKETKRLLSEDPSTSSPKRTKPGPRFFYPVSSAHLSQSDFGLLFKWISKTIFHVEEPERILNLNTRCILQMMRENGFDVAETIRIDAEEEMEAAKGKDMEVVESNRSGDWKILDSQGKVRGWIAVTTDLYEKDEDLTAASNKSPADAVVEHEVLGQTTK